MHCFGFAKQRGPDSSFLEIEETTPTATEYPSIHPREFLNVTGVGGSFSSPWCAPSKQDKKLRMKTSAFLTY